MSTLTDIEIDNMIKKASNKPPIPRKLFARDIIFDHKKNIMTIMLRNGMYMLFSLNDYSSLKKATPKERENWELLGGGTGIHWEDIDEDLSVKGFIRSYIEKTKSFIAENESVVA